MSNLQELWSFTLRIKAGEMKLSSSYISVNGMHFRAYHGVAPQERIIGSDFVVNVRAKYNVTKAMESDDVSDTINYARIYEIIDKKMQEPSCLLENLAGRIGKGIFGEMPEIETLDITIEKKNPPMGGEIGCASVEIHLINDKTF
ncbi:MAG: dihydroneopterin aldolase [Prevotella sp.]|nr:dihydroneopterin aldolase [Prevotella sp.]